ncbi:MAG: tungsten ABC transporter substrate-binding protein [Deltaproteobacteria bacterium]|nr:MAG: tungsten ABC transporter substrate-binding protein [Deltaproteobacteria bacterium]
MLETTLFLLLLALTVLPARAEERLRMSTTTSTENSGLLSVLLPPFEKRYNCKVDVVAVGTGKSLKLGETGDVDVVFVHARSLEDKFVANGYGVNRRDVMYNDFVLLGPPDDPAGVGKASSAPEALRAIAAKGIPFISRGDESGTHVKEKEIWAAAGMVPRGAWYIEAGQGMGEVLTMATQKRGYTLSDRGTYIAFRKKTDLVVLRQGDKNLWNPYGIIAVNPKTHAHAKYDLAMKLIDFVTGPEGRSLIAGYKVDGEQLFFLYGEGDKH